MIGVVQVIMSSAVQTIGERASPSLRINGASKTGRTQEFQNEDGELHESADRNAH